MNMWVKMLLKSTSKAVPWMMINKNSSKDSGILKKFPSGRKTTHILEMDTASGTVLGAVYSDLSSNATTKR